MLRSGFTSFLAIFVICSFCGGEFKSLGRHAWRCKEKLNSFDKNDSEPKDQRKNCNSSVFRSDNASKSVSTCSEVKCCCGKVCNGLCGLKMHQRSCRVIKGLSEETFESLDTDEAYEDTDQIEHNIDFTSAPKIKAGVKLPKSDFDWKLANDFFAASMPIADVNAVNINDIVSSMNSIIYNYFYMNFGSLDDTGTSEFAHKYKDYSTSMLKSTLNHLKQSNADVMEVRYVAKTLRLTLRRTSNSLNTVTNHDKLIKASFWSYVKQQVKQRTSSLPSFDSTTCTQFFCTFFRAINPAKSFKIPSWISPLPQPTLSYDLSPPSYHQVTKIVRRMKASGSPCPLDKISIIPFKRCPYLRSYITAVFRIIWQSSDIPNAWKKACTVLVHKKGDPSDPSTFRPITLESVPLRIFTSCVRDSMFAFLQANGYIEHQIQKGFLPKVTGTFEHTAQMASVINAARSKQKSLVITLLDLKNAFGEVHHNLIPEVLKYHHIPTQIQLLIGSLYSEFQTSVITDS